MSQRGELIRLLQPYFQRRPSLTGELAVAAEKRHTKEMTEVINVILQILQIECFKAAGIGTSYIIKQLPPKVAETITIDPDNVVDSVIAALGIEPDKKEKPNES